MKAIKILEKEHDNIRRLLQVIEAMAFKVLDGESFDVGDLRKVRSFIKDYSDVHHHSKEEAILFDYMKVEIGQVAEKLIDTGMMVEHSLARHYSIELENAINAYEKDPSQENTVSLLTYLLAYRELLTRHADKEDGAVYPFAERELKDSTKEIINSESLAYDEKFQQQAQKSLVDLDQLESKYVK